MMITLLYVHTHTTQKPARKAIPAQYINLGEYLADREDIVLRNEIGATRFMLIYLVYAQIMSTQGLISEHKHVLKYPHVIGHN